MVFSIISCTTPQAVPQEHLFGSTHISDNYRCNFAFARVSIKNFVSIIKLHVDTYFSALQYQQRVRLKLFFELQWGQRHNRNLLSA